MKMIGNFEFPETEQEYNNWEPIFSSYALHSKILCVAKTRIEGAWNAYIFPVNGINHGVEWQQWSTEGVKLEEHIACVLFPQFNGVPYAF